MDDEHLLAKLNEVCHVLEAQWCLFHQVLVVLDHTGAITRHEFAGALRTDAGRENISDEAREYLEHFAHQLETYDDNNPTRPTLSLVPGGKDEGPE